MASEDVGRFVGIAAELTERMVRIIRGMGSLARDASSDPFQNAQIASLIQDVLGELPVDEIRKITHENAAALCRHPLPEVCVP